MENISNTINKVKNTLRKNGTNLLMVPVALMAIKTATDVAKSSSLTRSKVAIERSVQSLTNYLGSIDLNLSSVEVDENGNLVAITDPDNLESNFTSYRLSQLLLSLEGTSKSLYDLQREAGLDSDAIEYINTLQREVVDIKNILTNVQIDERLRLSAEEVQAIYESNTTIGYTISFLTSQINYLLETQASASEMSAVITAALITILAALKVIESILNKRLDSATETDAKAKRSYSLEEVLGESDGEISDDIDLSSYLNPETQGKRNNLES